jgi:nitrate reductase NapD
MAKISGLVWAEFSHEQLVSWQFSMGKSDRLLVDILIGVFDTMHISGVVVHARPGHIDQARGQLNGVEGVEIHASDADGKLIVTIEQADERMTVDAFEQLNRLPDVLSATMVYHHFEPETDSIIQ